MDAVVCYRFKLFWHSAALYNSHFITVGQVLYEEMKEGLTEMLFLMSVFFLMNSLNFFMRASLGIEEGNLNESRRVGKMFFTVEHLLWFFCVQCSDKGNDYNEFIPAKRSS